MTSRHTGASFNHSCLKVPVNPSTHFPYTSYERKHVPHNMLEDNSTNRTRARKNTHFQDDSSIGLSPSPSYMKDRSTDVLSSQVKAQHDNINEAVAKDSLVSFLSFYESIPDYRDVNHLSDREFNIKIQNLKEKQRSYHMNISGVHSFAADNINSNNGRPSGISNDNQSKRGIDPTVPVHAHRPASPYKPIQKNLLGNNCCLEKKVLHPSCKPYQTKLQIHRSQIFWNKDDDPERNHVETPSTISLVSEVTNSVGKTVKASKPPLHSLKETKDQIIFESDSDGPYEPPQKLCTNINELIFKEKHGILFSPTDLYRSSKRHQATNRTRLIHSASSSKKNSRCRSGMADSPASNVDSVWDGLGIDDYIPKAEYMYSDSDSMPDARLPLAHSLPNSPTPVLKASKTVGWKETNVTVPEPFEMTIRDEEEAHEKAILSDIYEMTKSTDVKEEPTQFRANPVPLHAQLPLYDKIMSDQEKRRRKLHRQCIADLRSQMKPFSFIKRDEEQRHFRFCRSTPELRNMRGDSPKPFKAKPVPKNLFGSAVYQRMREDEFYRALKRKIRAEELLKSASLPPSMAAREQVSVALPPSAKCHRDPSESSTKKKHKIPNYKKSHDLLRKELDERLSENISTSPQPFHLRTGHLRCRRSRRSTPTIDSTSSSPYECFSAMFPQDRLRPRSALCHTGNRNNLAAVLRIQSARQRLEQEAAKLQDELTKKEAVRVKANKTRCRPVWRSLKYSTSDDLALRVQARMEEEQLRRERHEEEMERMLDRVERMPTLFQRQSQAKIRDKSKKQQKLHSNAIAPYFKRSLAFSSPDLFVGSVNNGSNHSGEVERKSSKVVAKVVTINETIQANGSQGNASSVSCKETGSEASVDANIEKGSRESGNGKKSEKEGNYESGDERDEDEYCSSVQENMSDEDGSDEENDEQHSECNG